VANRFEFEDEFEFERGFRDIKGQALG